MMDSLGYGPGVVVLCVVGGVDLLCLEINFPTCAANIFLMNCIHSVLGPSVAVAVCWT